MRDLGPFLPIKRAFFLGALINGLGFAYAQAQTKPNPQNDIDEILLAPSVWEDNLIVTGVYDAPEVTRDIGASVRSLSEDDLENIALVHPAEALNGVAGVNIQRGSGQEHLSAIRSPVLTGGAGAGSFLYLEDGVPLRAAGFANVNGLFEAGTEFAGGVDVFKGPGPAFYGSNAVHGLIGVNSQPIDAPNFIRLLGSTRGLLSGLTNKSSNSNTKMILALGQSIGSHPLSILIRKQPDLSRAIKRSWMMIFALQTQIRKPFVIPEFTAPKLDLSAKLITAYWP